MNTNTPSAQYNVPFEYDPFQKEAMLSIDQHCSLLISAPTGAGKTCIAEYAIDQAMREGKSAIYTAPIKALSNQKYRDFRERYGDTVGIITGDVTINNQAPLLIMTTEIYRNRIFENLAKLDETAWIIFDEIHYLDDIERGTVWEESIMFSPPHVKFVCLSATVPNIGELAGWMNTVHNRNIKMIIEEKRPVPLTHLFQAQGKIIRSFKGLKKDGYLNLPDWSQIKNPDRNKYHHNHRKKNKKPFYAFHGLTVKQNRIDELIQTIRDENGLPCIYFAFARKRTELLAHELTSFTFLTPQEQTQVIQAFDSLCEQYEITDEPTIQTLRALVKRGIAFHHAGMLPTAKEVIERLFTSKLIKLIFTTETFALGINMPAKTVIFDELRKFHGTHFGPLRTRDYYQMAGRAGRRGMDTQGTVYSRINPRYASFKEVEQIICNAPEPVMSQFNATYATLLNLYNQFGEELFTVYPLSFHYFQSSKRGRSRALDALRRRVELLKYAEYIKNNALTDKGVFASCMYGYELLLAEMLEDGLLENLSVKELLILLVSLVFEPRKGDYDPPYNDRITHLMSTIRPYYKHVHKLEKIYAIFPQTKPPFFHLAPAIIAWAEGCDFHAVFEHTAVDEGGLVRYFRMTIQLLRLIREAPHVSKTLETKAHKAITLINRDEIDAEKQLRV